MRTDSQPVTVTGWAGGGGDGAGPTGSGKAHWYCKYLGGAGGDWDLHFPGAKRAIVTPTMYPSANALLAVGSNPNIMPIRISNRNTAGSPVNGSWFFTAQVWY